MATDIQGEITRIENAKASCVVSLQNKGVTVPSGVKLGGIPALIDSIPEPVSDVIKGSATGTNADGNGRKADVTITFNDVVKGKGGTVYLVPDSGDNQVVLFRIILKTDGSIQAWSGGSGVNRNYTINSVSWNTEGDILTAQIYNATYGDIGTVINKAPIALWVG